MRLLAHHPLMAPPRIALSPGFLAAGLAMALLYVLPAWAAPNASFLASPIQGSTCVAPCAVHFDATPTSDPNYSRSFHSLKYEWDFGDPSSGFWRYGPAWASDKNSDFGPIAGHVYTSAGNYSIELKVTNPSGQVDTAVRSVNIVDPADHFPTSETFCFANSAGTFQGCALDTNNDGTCDVQSANCQVTSDFDDAIRDDCNAYRNQRWCAFRAGDTFNASRVIPLNRGTNGDPGLVSSFGGPGKAFINHNAGDEGTINPRNHWTITNLRIDSNHVIGREGFRLGFSNHTTVYDAEIVNNGGNCWSDGGGTSSPRNLNAVFELDCTMSTRNSMDSTVLASPVFWKADRVLIYGIHIDNSDTGEFNARTVHATRNAFKHNFLENPQDNDCEADEGVGCNGWRHNMSWRAYNNSTVPGHPPSEWNVISFNEFERVGSIEGWVDFCASNSCTPTGGNNRQSNLIYEFNWHYNRANQPASSQNLQNMIEIQRGNDFTVRNNIFDATGHVVPGPSIKMVAFGQTFAQSNIHVYNNTVYHPHSLPNRFVICEGRDAGSNHFCRNNLAWVANLTGTKTKASFRYVESNNFMYCTGGECDSLAGHPFTGTLPRVGQTRPESFRIRPSVTALQDTGFDFSGTNSTYVATDFYGSCRGGASSPANGWDIGAHEVGGFDCVGNGTPTSTFIQAPIMLPEL